MGIQFSMSTQMGLSFDYAYAKIGQINVNYLENFANMIVYKWKDHDARIAGYAPVSVDYYSITVKDTFDTYFSSTALSIGNIQTAAYNYLIALENDFVGATTV